MTEGIGQTNVYGYNRLKQNAQFCFIMAVLASSPAVLKAGAATTKDIADPIAPQVRSVVRVDAQSHRLIRVFEAAGVPRAHSTQQPDPAVRTLVEKASKTYDVSPALVQSVISVESGFNAYAVSPKGALGIMQLMPETARRFGVSNAFDVKQNIEGGVRYLRFLQDTFRDDALTMAAYNAGEHAVEKYNGVPPYPETVAYVKKVSARYGKARKEVSATRAGPAAGNGEASGEKHPPLEMFYDEQGRVYIKTR